MVVENVPERLFLICKKWGGEGGPPKRGLKGWKLDERNKKHARRKLREQQIYFY